MNNYLSVSEFSKKAGISRQGVYKLSKKQEYTQYFVVLEGKKKVDIKLLERLQKPLVNSLQEVDNEVDNSLQSGLHDSLQKKDKKRSNPHQIHVDNGLHEVDNEVDNSLQSGLHDNQQEKEIERLKKEVEELRKQLNEKNEIIVDFAGKFAELAKNAQIISGIQTTQVKQIEEITTDKKEKGFFKRIFGKKGD